MASNWKSLRAGEEKAESLLNTDEDDGSNNGKANTDSTGTAHGFLQAKEMASIRRNKLKSLKERLMETEEEARHYRETRHHIEEKSDND